MGFGKAVEPERSRQARGMSSTRRGALTGGMKDDSGVIHIGPVER